MKTVGFSSDSLTLRPLNPLSLLGSIMQSSSSFVLQRSSALWSSFGSRGLRARFASDDKYVQFFKELWAVVCWVVLQLPSPSFAMRGASFPDMVCHCAGAPWSFPIVDCSRHCPQKKSRRSESCRIPAITNRLPIRFPFYQIRLWPSDFACHIPAITNRLPTSCARVVTASHDSRLRFFYWSW